MRNQLHVKTSKMTLQFNSSTTLINEDIRKRLQPATICCRNQSQHTDNVPFRIISTTHFHFLNYFHFVLNYFHLLNYFHFSISTFELFPLFHFHFWIISTFPFPLLNYFHLLLPLLFLLIKLFPFFYLIFISRKNISSYLKTNQIVWTNIGLSCVSWKKRDIAQRYA